MSEVAHLASAGGTARRARIAAFAAVCAICVAVPAGYLLHAQGRERARRVEGGVVNPGSADAAAVAMPPHVFFRSMAEGQAGLAAIAPLGVGPAAPGARVPLDLECTRVYFAGGNGLCLTDQGSLFTPYDLIFLGPDLLPRHTQSLAGLISRARVSPDGRYGAATVFVTGHNYATSSFSTQTTIYDMASGQMLEDVEFFEVYKDGERIESPDFNFWGVTFDGRKSGQFYATLGTGGHTYLVRGDLGTLRVDVLRDGVECPSLSPDGTRIAFKQRVKKSGPVEWRPAVLDLATLEDHVLAEHRNVDDQIEWLDDTTVLYAVTADEGPPGTWATPADGSGEPRLFLADADSPSIVRD